MAKYAVDGTKGTTSVRMALVANNTTTARRFSVYDFLIGCTTTPADAMFTHRLQRTTDDPTGTAETPSPLEDGAPADPDIDGFDAITADGTLTGAVLVAFSLHHRASFRWVANPGGELTAPATDNNGIGAILGAATTSDFESSMHLEA